VELAPLGSLRQHPLHEVDPFLRLADLLAQSAHLGVQGGQASNVGLERIEPCPHVAATHPLPQVMGPQSECHGQPGVRHGMPRLTGLHREARGDRVQPAQGDRDREPRRWLDAHGRLLVETIVRDEPSMTRSTSEQVRDPDPERSPS